jgi:tRNA(fMet)-specific endonuclease VapC
MIRYLLDSNVWISHLKGVNLKLSLKLVGTPHGDLAVCSVVWAELLHGATKYHDPAKREQQLATTIGSLPSLNFDTAAARHYAKIRHQLEIQGNMIGGNDLMIAAIALANDLTVVTNNTSDFQRVPGLPVEDWSV